MSIRYKSINELKNMLSTKKISHTELIQETFSSIKNNSELNAFVTLNEEESFKKAKNLDSNPSPGALAGIPIAQKDLFCTKNLKTTCGSNMLSNFVPPYSATVIENLENAVVFPLVKQIWMNLLCYQMKQVFMVMFRTLGVKI